MVRILCSHRLFRASCCHADDGARKSLSLDGKWEIIFDHKNVGRDADWRLDKVFSMQRAKRNINVPSCWEEIEKDYEGVAFYRRTFKVPANWEGKIIHLHFDAVNFLSEVWINDKAVGFHTTQTFSKKETLKRPFLSLEGSITKLLTARFSGAFTRPPGSDC